MGGRNYLELTKKKLFSYSLNKCYNPSCKTQILFDDSLGNISKISHICAHSVGGPRFNPNMTDKERDAYENLLILCGNCHDKVDADVNTYTVQLLQSWKLKREKEAMASGSNVLNTAINAIANLDNFDDIKNTTEVFKPEDKISFNELKIYESEIQELKIYQGKVDSIYTVLEEEAPFRKEKLLNVIKAIYNEERVNLLTNKLTNGKTQIEIIKKNSDILYAQTKMNLEKRVLNSCQDENIIIALPIIMVDAFMRCKILEEPKDDN